MVQGFMFTTEPFSLSSSDREQLEQLARSTRGPAGLARRARVLLLLADGLSLRAVCTHTGMSPRRIRAWKHNWQQRGLDGLLDAPRPGRPKKLTAAREASVLAATKGSPPTAVTHWSTRRLAKRMGVSHMTVMRLWHKAGLQPHRLRSYMASPDPDFEAKAKDILGLYLDPPKNAAVFCVDEKTAIQALDRSQPALPLRAGEVERRSVEYVRHGTVSLFAALEVHKGKVLGRCAPRHTSEEFVEFLNQAMAGEPRKTIHVILDNLAVHKTALVRAWQQEHPNVHFHFTPTYTSWLNQVEIWFGMISRDCIRRGVFHSVPDLIHKIVIYIRQYNRNAQPFRWTYTNPRKRIRVPLSSVTEH
jgi:transposase